MRYRDLLLEYDRSKTYSVWWPRLATKIINDNSIRNNTRSGDVKNQLFANRHALDKLSLGSASVIAILDHIEATDPTPNKEYVQWVLQRYCDGGIQRWEDLDRVREYLEEFHQIKTSGYFRRVPADAQLADIGRFRRLSELGAFLAKVEDAGGAVSNAAADRAEETRLIQSGEAVVMADTPRIRIIIPRTWEAAKYFGRNTEWCTSMKEVSGHFEAYAAQGSLYIILDKAKNKRWQFHFQSGQFMDEHDEPINDGFDDNWGEFPREAFDFLRIEDMDGLSKANFLLHSKADIFDLDEKISKTCDRRTLAFLSHTGARYIKEERPLRTVPLTGFPGVKLRVYKDLEALISYLCHNIDNLHEIVRVMDETFPLTELNDILTGNDNDSDTPYQWIDVEDVFDRVSRCGVMERNGAHHILFCEREHSGIVFETENFHTTYFGADEMSAILKGKDQTIYGKAMAALFQGWQNEI